MAIFRPEMLLWVAVGAALGYGAARVLLGYPEATGFRRLARREVAFVEAAANAMFPAGGPLPPSGSEAGSAAFLDAYLASVPPRLRRLMRLLFLLMEHGTLLFPAPAPRGWRRFSSLSAEQRAACLDGWRASGWFPRRLAFASLRALLTNAYVADAGVLRHLGLEPRPIEAPAVEADRLYPPIGRPRSEIRHPRASSESHPGEVRVFADYERDFREEADVVVVGSGPCGAVVAKELACAGRRVVLLEEGPPFTPADFELDGARSMARTMREGGLRATRGTVMPTLQAICLGGGSLVNSAICVRPPDFVFDAWCTQFDLARTSGKDLAPHFDAVSAFLGVAPTPEEVQGRRNLLFRDGCAALGYPAESIPRNVRGCRGSGECFTGCRSRAKQSMDLSYVPAAIAAGARVLTSVRVEEVRAQGARATGVVGRVVAPFSGRASHRFQVDAKVVVLAAGCMATPVLLQKSGNLANGSGQVGRNLQFHPGVMVTGVFAEPVEPAFGATQSYQSLHFLREGFKLETFWAPPTALALRMPGMGSAFKERLAEIPRSATWDAILSCHRSLGSVRARSGASLDPALTWHFAPEDVPLMGRAMFVLAEILFAAGAEKVIPGVHGLPDELRSLDEARVLATRSWRSTDVTLGSTHAFCTTRMHGDPRHGVVDELGRCHDLDNLYVADTGVFPRCSSVNPMLTGMALAHRTAAAVLARL